MGLLDTVRSWFSAPAKAGRGRASMRDADDILDAIVDAAQKPASVTYNGQTVVQHNLKDLMDAHRFVAAHGTARRGIRVNKMTPPGAV